MAECFAFETFVLDTGDRRLRSGNETVELNGRYFDALTLLIRERGKLVSKDRFLEEVWRGVPVTDEALTQCIRTLRRQLSDDASSPRFIETVPKHGYRFIAPVELIGPDRASSSAPRSESQRWRQFVVTATAGTLGGAAAGLIGGLIYGFVAASQPTEAGLGGMSIVLVLVSLTMLVGIIGAAGVSLALATAFWSRPASWQWLTVAGAGGGLVVGAVVKLLGLDAFSLLVGQSPGNITGSMEGAILGAAVGFGAWLASRTRSLRTGAAMAALCGGVAGLVIPLLGGRLMAGSLDLLAHSLPKSRLHLDRLGAIFGESGLGPISQSMTGALEGALFAGCVVGAMVIAQRTPRGQRRLFP
jgi:DNA-binding winged helix-turn-helix (wHTH) protein